MMMNIIIIMKLEIKIGERTNAKPENKIKAKILKRDLYRYDTKSDLMHQETER